MELQIPEHKPWLTLTEVIEKTGLVRRTVERRLGTMRKHAPRVYLMTVNDLVNPYLFKNPEFIHMIKLRADRIKKLGKHHKKESEEEPNESKQTVPDIWNEPIPYLLNDEELGLYDEISNEKHQGRFLLAHKILTEYRIGLAALDDCCQMFGSNRHQLAYWAKKVPQIAQLYLLAKEQHLREFKQYKIEYLEEQLYKASSGYYVEETTVYYKVISDRYGNQIKIAESEKVLKKWIPANTRAMIVTLNSLKPEKYPYVSFSVKEGQEKLMNQLKAMTDSEIIQYVRKNA